MNLVVDRAGQVRCVYSESIDLATLGRIEITRASRVEPDRRGDWCADLRPVGGPGLGPFSRRSEALEAEVDWLEAHWLTPPARTVRSSPAAPLSSPPAQNVPKVCPVDR